MAIPEQIKNLKDDNLTIEDEEEAARILQRVSYYRLIKAYCTPFKDKASGKYRKNASFNHIYGVYKFDDRLRHLLIPYLQEIEIAFRCQIANFFCVKYGVLGYLDRNNFDEYASHSELMNKIYQCLDQAKESPIVKHFKKEYDGGEPPLYAAVELFTFGALALFYNSMKVEDRKEIAALYEGVDEGYLSSWLVSIGYVRNLCSHYNRLYNKSLVKKPRLYKKQDGGVRNDRLYAVLCCMRYLLKGSSGWRTFVDSLDGLFKEYDYCVKPQGIGCPEGDWKEKLLDQEPQGTLSRLLSAVQLQY